MGLIALTAGEPAGIGGEITLSALSMLSKRGRQSGQGFSLSNFCVLADAHWWKQIAQSLQINLPTRVVHNRDELRIALNEQDARDAQNARNSLDDVSDGTLLLWHHPLATPAVAGQLDVRNAPYVLDLLNTATDMACQSIFSAVVTAPIQKNILMQVLPNFTGHTEYFAQRTHTDTVVMMLVSGTFRVALVTTHLPLSEVPKAITTESVSAVLQILHEHLRTQMQLSAPRIIVTGLNPHAGEDGHLGREEIEVITPVLKAARDRGWQVIGPLPADTAFQKKYLSQADCFLAMYHDQGLSVLKFAGFGESVNITLGLPFIRTSVDHGTALDLAGRGIAHCGSMIAAIESAQQILQASQSLPKSSC